MSIAGGKKKQTSNFTATQELDPIARAALVQVTGATQPFRTLPAVAPTDLATIAGAQRLQDRPQSAFIAPGEQSLTNVLSGSFLTPGLFGGSLSQLGGTLSGAFQGLNPAAQAFNQRTQDLQNSIIQAAQQAVGDQFTAAGRTGSPAQAITLGKVVANQLAPFQFGALESQLQRQSQAFENERQRQLAAASLGLDQFNVGVGQQLSALNLAPRFEPLLNSVANRLLQTGDILQQQNQLQIDQPFIQFQRFANPLLAAAGRFPVTTTQTGVQKGKSFRFGASLSDFK